MRSPIACISLALALTLAACGGPSIPPPSVADGFRSCPLLNPTNIPPDFELDERSSVGAGENFLSDAVIFRHPDGRFLAFDSGSPGGVGGIGTGQKVIIRGHEAEIFHEATLDELAVIWLETTPEQPCHQYSISAGGLSVAEFIEVLAGVK